MAKTVVWQTGSAATEFEKQFVEEVLLAKVQKESVHYDGKFLIGIDNSIVIISHNRDHAPPELIRYLSGLKGTTLIHLSGESLYPSGTLYGYANSVLRSYYDPRIQEPNVFTIPLGFKSGFLSSDVDSGVDAERDLMWFFAGEIKKHRAEMLACFREIEPHHFHIIQGWNSSAGLSVEQMRSYFRRAVFAPCPFGWINPDSFRIMEALENGSIPVSVEFRGRDYFRYVYGDHPFIVAKNWRQAAALMQSLTRRPAELRERQMRLVSWYDDFKDRLARDVKSIVEGNRRELVSEQFRYQAEGHCESAWKRAYSWHFRWKPRLAKVKNGVVKRLKRPVMRSRISSPKA